MYYKQTVEEVLSNLHTTPDGLGPKEVLARQKEYGNNELPSKKTSLFLLFIRQFNNVLVYILLAALALSVAAPFLEGHSTSLTAYTDAIVIFAILIVNAVFGFVQEFKAESAIAMLQELTAPNVRVKRNGNESIVAAKDLTVGDIVLLEAGDKISADGRLITVSHLQINESSLTGESLPQDKQTEALPAERPVADQDSMVFSGTLVTGGSGQYVVTTIGTSTEIGKISVLVASTEVPETPLQARLRVLGSRLGLIVLALTTFIALLAIWQQKPILEVLLIAVSLAVSAVPEGLPAVVTVCFALGVKRMVRKQALVRRLDALETLGSVTVICSDKTGTITENKMEVKDHWLFGQSSVEELAKIMASCNRAQLPDLGDPTEIGLLNFAKEQHVERLPIDDEEVPFNSTDKYMQTRHGQEVYIKGALEKVLTLANVQSAEQIEQKNNEFAKQGLRVLAAAKKVGDSFEFIGLVAMQDPPRASAADAIKLAKSAGIRSIMITGDNAITAQAIAHTVGIPGEVLTGEELDKLSEKDLRSIVETVSIYARVSPENKLQILHALQANGEVVAMSGDGVNDAPALKGAHVGVAMGKVGTQVAREAASMVLADDHFSTIVTAIAEGRRIYDNIKKFVLFLLRTNFSSLLFITVTVAFNLPLPYLPLHILWINLVTDGLPALALSVEKAEPDIMERKPRPQTEGILHNQFGGLVVYAVIGFAVSMFLYMYLLSTGASQTYLYSMILTLAICYELLFVHSVRSMQPLSRIGFVSNPWLIGAVAIPFSLHLVLLYSPLSSIMYVEPLNVQDWLLLLPCAAIGLISAEVQKYIRLRKLASTGQ